MRYPALLFLILICACAARAQTNGPVLISQPNSTRAIAFDSPSFPTEPFALNSPTPWTSDSRTRVMLFVLNLALSPGEDVSAITAEAEDGQHQLFSLKVEALSSMPGLGWLTALVLRLNDNLSENGDVLVRVTYHGVSSNRVRIGIGHVGDGLPDDPGSAPTPAPPYTVSGRVVADGVGLSNVSVALSGTQSGTVQTDSNGAYSLTVNQVGNYTVTPSLTFYNFSPQAVVFAFLTGPQTDVNFTASRITYSISGHLLDGAKPITGATVTLSGFTSATATTDATGFYSFMNLQAGRSYTVTPAKTYYAFTPPNQSTASLENNQTVDFKGTPTYRLAGRATDDKGNGLAGVAMTMSGAESGTTQTAADGTYSFLVHTTGDYTLTPTNDNVFTFSPQTISNLSADLQVNFQGTRHTYTINGLLKDVDSSGIANTQVMLSGNSTTQTVTTDAQGRYSFSPTEAGYSYTLTPVSGTVFAFTAQQISSLTSNLSIDCQAARRTYYFGGHVSEGTKPLSGATITLSGFTSATTTTDATGFYSFMNLQAGRSYTITPTKAFFTFAPPDQSTPSLENNQIIDFNGTASYHLTGRALEAGGKALGGIVITVSGPESSVLQTASDGTYSVIVHTSGNYTLTASADQDYYTISPATQTLANVDSDRSADFTGTFSLASDPAYVLEFDGTPKTVDCGVFWPGNIPLGHFFWEVWGQPGSDAGATYLISDGYGGAHALLFGFASYGASEPGRYELLGDIWDGSQLLYFGSDEGPAVNEWGHFAVGWDGRQIITYFNGVPSGRVPFTGPRISPGPGWGAGRLLLGGSDHSNLMGRMAQVRGYEDRNPREDSSVTAAFAPEAVFSRAGSYLSYFFRQSQIIADLSSDGYQGQAHRGLLRGTLYPYGLLSLCPNCPLPEFVVDPSAPKFLTSPVNNSAPVAAAPSTPANALIFDSFSRANSTYTMGKGGLGSTETGSAGSQQWQTSQTSTGQEPFGILNGRAVLLANEMALAWVPVNSANGNLDIQVNRHAGIWGSGFDTGIAFRVSDSRNFFFAYTSGNEDDPATARKLSVGYYLNGVRTDLVTNLSVTGNWTTLEVTSHSNGQIAVATDQGIIYSGNSSILANATDAGLYSNGPGLGLFNRWDNFTVSSIP